MIAAGKLNSMITFRKSIDGEWTDIISCHAYINGLSGSEFFAANAGYEASLTVEISCRYQPALMKIIPMNHRIVCGGTVYELISPADDVMFRHEEIRFRGKRIYTEADGQ